MDPLSIVAAVLGIFTGIVQIAGAVSGLKTKYDTALHEFIAFGDELSSFQDIWESSEEVDVRRHQVSARNPRIVQRYDVFRERNTQLLEAIRNDLVRFDRQHKAALQQYHYALIMPRRAMAAAAQDTRRRIHIFWNQSMISVQRTRLNAAKADLNLWIAILQVRAATPELVQKVQTLHAQASRSRLVQQHAEAEAQQQHLDVTLPTEELIRQCSPRLEEQLRRRWELGRQANLEDAAQLTQEELWRAQHHIDQIEADLANAQQQVQQLVGERNQAIEAYQNAVPSERHQAIVAELDELKQRHNNLQIDYANMQAQRDHLEGLIQALQQKFEAARHNAQQYSARYEQDRVAQESRNETNAQFQQQQARELAHLQQLNGQLRNTIGQHGAQVRALQNELAQARRERANEGRQLQAQLEHTARRAREERENLRRDQKQLRAENRNLRHTNKRLNWENESFRRRRKDEEAQEQSRDRSVIVEDRERRRRRHRSRRESLHSENLEGAHHHDSGYESVSEHEQSPRPNQRKPELYSPARRRDYDQLHRIRRTEGYVSRRRTRRSGFRDWLREILVVFFALE